MQSLRASGPGRDGNEGVLHIPQSPTITGTSPLDCLLSYPGHFGGGGLIPLQRSSRYILQSQPTEQQLSGTKKHAHRECTRHDHQSIHTRFYNSYEIPSYIYSDNARSFDNAQGKDIIEHHLDSNKFRNNFISHTIT